MIETDIRKIFATKISLSNDVINLPGGATVPVKVFANLFKNASSNPTYEELVDLDGGKKGYLSFFDECKTEGILS